MMGAGGGNSQWSNRADLEKSVEGQGKLFITSLIAPEGLTTRKVLNLGVTVGKFCLGFNSCIY